MNTPLRCAVLHPEGTVRGLLVGALGVLGLGGGREGETKKTGQQFEPRFSCKSVHRGSTPNANNMPCALRHTASWGRSVVAVVRGIPVCRRCLQLEPGERHLHMKAVRLLEVAWGLCVKQRGGVVGREVVDKIHERPRE